MIYTIENRHLKPIEIDTAKADGHVHSRYSPGFIESPPTRFLGVRESETTPEAVYKRMQKRGMTFKTISDHDHIEGALKMRERHPDDSFINCEYTVNVTPEKNGQAIHVGCWGLDFAGDTTKPFPDNVVIGLHNELRHVAELGYQRFIDHCETIGIAYCLNHLAWQGTPKHPLTGKQIDEITDAFKIIEINSDSQLENLIALEMAIEKDKAICAGTDAHNIARVGQQYTSPIYPVDSIPEFLAAFKKGEIGIGSQKSLPKKITKPTDVDILHCQFNGTAKGFIKDSYQGVIDYFTTFRDVNPRKWALMSALAGLPSLASYAAGPEIGLPVTMPVEMAIIGALATVMPLIERRTVKKRTKKTYTSLHEHLKNKETAEEQQVIAEIDEKLEVLEKQKQKKLKHITALQQEHDSKTLPELEEKLPWYLNLLLNTLGRLKGLGTDYDESNRNGDGKHD